MASTTARKAQLSLFLAANFLAAGPSPASVTAPSPSASRTRTSTLKPRSAACAGVCSISFFTFPPVPSAVTSLPCCPGSVATLADTRPARRTHSRSLRTTLPANSGSPKPWDPWPPPAAGKVAPPRSVHPAEVRVPGSVLGPPLPAPTAPRATAMVPRPCTVRPVSEYCRSCRAPNKDWVPFPGSPSTAQTPVHSRPFVHTTRRLPPFPLPISRNPDSPAPATREPPQIGRRGCKLPSVPAAHSHTPDDPLPPTAPVQSRDRARPAGCTLSPAPPPHTDSPDTEIARAPASADRFPSTPVVQWMRTRSRRTVRVPRTPAPPVHS